MGSNPSSNISSNSNSNRLDLTSTSKHPLKNITTVGTGNNDGEKDSCNNPHSKSSDKKKRRKPKSRRFDTVEEEDQYLSTLSGPERALYHCRKENFLYKKCYSRWWKTAINGEKGDDIDRVDCDVLMQEYQDCVVGYLKKEGQRKSEE